MSEKIDDLMKMTVEELLDTYCITYSPECGYYYGVAKWDDVYSIYDKYDLEDEYCFDGDSLIPLDYGFDCGEEVLDFKDLECIMDKLGIIIRQSCPNCNSENYHFDYNKMGILCNDCGYLYKQSEVDDNE